MTEGICFAGLDVHARKTVGAAVQLGTGEVWRTTITGTPAARRSELALPPPPRGLQDAQEPAGRAVPARCRCRVARATTPAPTLDRA